MGMYTGYDEIEYGEMVYNRLRPDGNVHRIRCGKLDLLLHIRI